MTDNEYAKINLIADYASNWWYEEIKKYNMKNVSMRLDNSYDKLRMLAKEYKSNKADNERYERFRDLLKLEVTKELSVNDELVLETRNQEVGKLKEYMDSLDVKASVPKDVKMLITRDDITLLEGYGFNREPRIIFMPKGKQMLLRK